MSATTEHDPNCDDRVAILIERFDAAESALQAELSGQVDSVLLGDGRTFLLEAARKALIKSLEAQAQLGAIVQSSADAIIGIDLKGLVTTWNRSAEVIFGYSAEEMIGESALRIVPKQRWAEETANLRLVAQGRAAPAYESVHLWKDAKPVNISVVFSPIENMAGVVTGTSKVVRDVTDRVSAEVRSRESENLLQIAGRVARLGGWSLDLTAARVTWSDEVCIIHDVPAGTSPRLEEAIDFYAAEWRPAMAAAVENCSQLGIPYDLELEVITAKGRRLWARAIGIPSRDANGTITGLQGAFQDIHERKLAELELNRTNRALQMLSRCNEALIRTDDENTLLHNICQVAVETGGYAMAWVGYTEHDADKSIAPVAQMGDANGYLSQRQFSWSEDSEFGQGPAGRSVRTGEVIVVDDAATEKSFIPWRRAFLASGFRSVISLPLRGNGLTLGVLVLYSGHVAKVGPEEIKLLRELADDLAFGMVNIRGRQHKMRADTKILEQAALLDKAQDAILVCDLEERVTYWNKSAERLYGWPEREAIGKTLDVLIQPEKSDLAEAMGESLSKGEWTGELRTKSQEGRQIILEGRWTLVTSSTGEPTCVMSINTDITAKKKAEDQVLRTQRIESIGALASGIAHDLNNVLSPILMGVGILNSAERNPTERRVLKTIETSAKRGAEMVRQILGFARGGEGRNVATPPGHIINEVAIVVRETFPKTIELQIRVARRVWAIVGDPTQLHQVLLNLAVNARDAMPTGGILTIKAENITMDEKSVKSNHEGEGGPHVLIQVKDTGMGIPPEIRAKIFEPFFTTKPLGEGTGLGLATVSMIMKGLKGFIEIESSPGLGTTFKLYFPAAVSDAVAEGVESPTDGPRGHGECILVVDDDAAVRMMTQHMLEASGYRVLTANNGAEGVAAFAKHMEEVALVLTDLTMPIMDGPAMIRALASLDPAVRVIATSGRGSDGDLVRAKNPEVSCFLQKPYSVATVLMAIQQILDG